MSGAVLSLSCARESSGLWGRIDGERDGRGNPKKLKSYWMAGLSSAAHAVEGFRAGGEDLRIHGTVQRVTEMGQQQSYGRKV